MTSIASFSSNVAGQVTGNKSQILVNPFSVVTSMFWEPNARFVSNEGFKDKNKTIKTEYDKFKDETSITGTVHLADCGEFVGIPGHADFIVSILLNGQNRKAIKSITLSAKWPDRFGSTPEFIFFIDDKRLALGRGTSEFSTVRALGRNWSEGVATIGISISNLQQIAVANKIEAKIGDVLYDLPNTKPERIQVLIPLMKEVLTTLNGIGN
jgi:hypothetical protein